MAEVVRSVCSKLACQLLHNKFIVVLGDSIQRSLYKDLVLYLQRDNLLRTSQLKTKGEISFEHDSLVEGGCLDQMHNGTEYREVRQFQTDHHLVRFYFVTRIYSGYMHSILEDFRQGLTPDVVIINSCLWDISRYCSHWVDDYKENLNKFFEELRGILPERTLTLWNLTMPVGERIRGGFLVPEIEQKGSQLRHDVIEANFYSGTLADAYGMDVLDLHFHFRFSLHHRANDGVHWNAIAHRRITSLLLLHIAQAWGIIMPFPLADKGESPLRSASNYYPPLSNYFSNKGKGSNIYTDQHPSKENYDGYREEFVSDSYPEGFVSFEDPNPRAQNVHHESAGDRHKHGQVKTGLNSRPPHHSEPYRDHLHENVMRKRHTRPHYAPYTHPRRCQYNTHYY